MRAVISGVTAGVVLAAAISAPRAQAQQPDLAHAKELYDAANQAMNENRFDDAAQGYGAAYDITHDPILFFKIGVANEKAGRCDTALIYFRRYIKEAKPEAQYQAMAEDHIRACHGDVPTDQGSAVAEPEAGSGAGSALVTPPPPVSEHPRGNDAAWLMVGGGLAFVTLGAVLAYAASSSEQDLKDLYVGLDGNPPVYDAALAKRYQGLLDEGHRYEHLSWGAFGVAGGFAVAATVLFLRDRHESRIEPVVTTHSAGVSVHF